MQLDLNLNSKELKRHFVGNILTACPLSGNIWMSLSLFEAQLQLWGLNDGSHLVQELVKVMC